MSLIKTIHDPIHNRRTFKLISAIKVLLPPECSRIADIGCGDGRIGKALETETISVEGWDVHPRETCAVPFNLFDGKTIELEDNAVDVSIIIDVLHHDTNPEIILKEASRISRLGVIIKDHLCRTKPDLYKLKLMDWVGNRHYGVRLPYNYLSPKQWQELFHNCGLQKQASTFKLNLYPQPFESIFGGNLHFVTLLSKGEPLTEESAAYAAI